jgi:pantothenate kinase-related protein Tda10
MLAMVLDFSDFFWIWVIVALSVSGLSVYLKPKDQARLRRLEGKLDLLLEHAGLANNDKVDVPPEVLEALRRGDKIAAIKFYQDATGAGLKEAKERVEAIQASENL